MNVTATQTPSFNPRENRALTIVMGALLFAFGWQIRGTGTSDPSVVILLFLLFLSVHYSPRKKFDLIIFSLAIYIFGFMRTGWGTFVGQAGIPGLYPGHIPPNYGEGHDIVVQWWQGYFWLFIVGISWSGFASLIFGGYFFTTIKYTLKDLTIAVILFTTGRYLGGYVAELVIPLIAPQYYYDIYLPGLSTRNYTSMYGNLATAIAIIPVLLYVYFIIKDKGFVKRSLIVMVIFAIGLSVADIWQAIGRNNLEWELPFWSLWEYFSGLIIGLLIFWFYSMLSETDLRESDISPGLEFMTRLKFFDRFVICAAALYFLVLYGLKESLSGSIQRTFEQLDIKTIPSEKTIQTVLLAIALPLYYFYHRGNIGTTWSNKSFREKSLVALILLLPVYYFLFAMPHLAGGTLFQLKVSNSAVWLDTISFVVVESYCLYLYRQLKRELSA